MHRTLGKVRRIYALHDDVCYVIINDLQIFLGFDRQFTCWQLMRTTIKIS